MPAASRGDIVHQVQVASDRDADPADNSSTVTAVAVDGRNGAYKAYAANGRAYDLTIDFDALNYTMTGGAAPETKTFVAGAGEFIVGGTHRLRTAADLVVGNHDFGTGLLPYIAARRFGTTLVDGVFNLATRNVAADGTATTHPGTARISGNVLSVCQTDTSVSATQVCPVVLRITCSACGDVYTGPTRAAALPSLPARPLRRFDHQAERLAAPDAPSTSRRPAGAADSPGERCRADITRAAGFTDVADWVRMELDAANISYAVLGSASPLPTNDQAGLQRISSSGPFAMMVGKRLTDSSDIYVLQTAPLAVVIGAFDDTASGTFQVAVP